MKTNPAVIVQGGEALGPIPFAVCIRYSETALLLATCLCRVLPAKRYGFRYKRNAFFDTLHVACRVNSDTYIRYGVGIILVFARDMQHDAAVDVLNQN